MKYSESDLLIPALEIVQSNPGISTSGIIQLLSKSLLLSDEDLLILDGRKDTVFSQTVRNLCGSHYSTNEFGRCTDSRKVAGVGCFWINDRGRVKI